MREQKESNPKPTLSKAARRRAKYRKSRKEIKHIHVPSAAESPDMEVAQEKSLNAEQRHDNESTSTPTLLASYGPSIISAVLRLPGNLVGVVPGYFWSYTFLDLLQGGPDVITADVKVEIAAAASGFTALAYLRQYLEGLRGQQNTELAHLIARLERLLCSMNLSAENKPTPYLVDQEIRAISEELTEIISTDSGFKKFRDGLVITLDTIKNQGGAALVCVLLIQYFFKAIDDPWTAICFYGDIGYGAVNGFYEAYQSVGTTSAHVKKIEKLSEALEGKAHPETVNLLKPDDQREDLPLLRQGRAAAAEGPSCLDSLTSKVEPVWNFIRGIPYSVASVVPFAFWVQNFMGVMTAEAASPWQAKAIMAPVSAVVACFGIWAQQTGNKREGQKQKLNELIARLDVLLEKKDDGSYDQFLKEMNEIQRQLDKIIAEDSRTKQIIDRLKLLVEGFKNSTGACLVVLLCTDFFLSSLASPSWKHWTGIGATGAFGLFDALLSKSAVVEVKELEEETKRLISVLKGNAPTNESPRGLEY